MKTKKTIPIVLLLVLMLSVVTVQGFIVDMHYSINRESLASCPNCPITQEIAGYEDYFYMCDEITDCSLAHYFDKDVSVSASWFDNLVSTFSFRMGKPYRATHDIATCLNGLPEARNIKEKACGYGICAHTVQDTVAHNSLVPLAVRKTGLSNGLVHSPVEIYYLNKISTVEDYHNSRDVLDLSYEMTPYLTKVFSANPNFKDIDVPTLVDFFVKQVQPDSQFKLGFQSFFALPSWIYWMLFFLFLIGVALLALVVRKLLDGEVNTITVFSGVFSFLLFSLTTLAIYGLATGNVWGIWMWLSQVLFSYVMYPVAFVFLIGGLFLVFKWFKSKNLWANIGTLLVAVVVIVLGLWFTSLPGALDVGSPKTFENEAVANTVTLLTGGVNAVKNFPDPSGYMALKNADDSGSVGRTFILIVLSLILVGILYLTFKPRKKTERRLLV